MIAAISVTIYGIASQAGINHLISNAVSMDILRKLKVRKKDFVDSSYQSTPGDFKDGQDRDPLKKCEDRDPTKNDGPSIDNPAVDSGVSSSSHGSSGNSTSSASFLGSNSDSLSSEKSDTKGKQIG